MEFQFAAPCYFGLESAAAYDFKKLGARQVQATDGRITFSGDERLLANANLWSRCTERILIQLASFPANSFDELFDGVYALPWEDYIPKTAKFPVKGSSLSSTLSSVPACQRIVKKAVVERLLKGHGVSFLPERGDEYRIRFQLRKNEAQLFLDTTGDGLHKRGYRRQAGLAPLKETLAAALADFARLRSTSQALDPCCGSGTLLIEAALKARNIAPGLQRSFAAEHYAFLPPGLFDEEREKARQAICHDAPFAARGSDIDPAMVALAQQNAKKAGVGGCCSFEVADAACCAPRPEEIMLTNPPYGERMMEDAAVAALERSLGEATRRHPPHSAYIITADAAFERHFGRRATKRRKVYNGMIPCQIYMYYG